MLAMLALSGCSPVSTVQNSQGLSAPPAAATNSPPVIGGQPSTVVATGAFYSFTPAASDADGDALAFSVENKPAWATFSVGTGRLSGTPATGDTGSFTGITIRVTDGKATTSLPAFTVTVTSSATGGNNTAGTANGTAMLSWTTPTQNTDGSPLTDLAGYWIYYGRNAATLGRLQQITNPSTTQYQAAGLASGSHYFAITAYNSSGIESILSAVGLKNVP